MCCLLKIEKFYKFNNLSVLLWHISSIEMKNNIGYKKELHTYVYEGLYKFRFQFLINRAVWRWLLHVHVLDIHTMQKRPSLRAMTNHFWTHNKMLNASLVGEA